MSPLHYFDDVTVSAFYASPNIMWPEALCFLAVCESVRESVHESESIHASQLLLSQHVEEYWTNFHQTFSINGEFWNRDEAWSFGVRRSGSRSWWVQYAGKCAFGLVNTMSWKLLDWILPNFQCIKMHQLWCILGLGWTSQLFGVKRSKVKVSAWPRPSGWCWRHTELDALCLVLISSFQIS